MAIGRRADRITTAVSRGSLDALLVGVMAALVYVLHGFHGALSRDLGIFVYGGVQVAHGHPPYVANFNTVGPLADAVPGLAIALGRLVGIGPVLAPRLLYWLISAACCALVYLYARQLTRSRAGGFLGAALFLPFGTFLDLATNGPREKTLMVLFLVAGLALSGQRRWIAAGVATALATLAWQPAVLPLAAAAAVLALGAPRRWSSVGRYIVGGAGTTVVALAWFAAYGAVGTAIKAFLVTNVRWVHQPSALHDLQATWGYLWRGYHAAVVIALGGVVVLVVAAVRDRRNLPLGAAAVGGVVAVAWTASAINGSPDLLVVLPFGAVGSAVLVVALVRRLRGRRGMALVAVVAAAAVVWATVLSITTRVDGLIVQVRDVHAVVRHLPPGATIATIDAPQPLVLSGRRNPTPYLILDSGELGLFEHERPGGVTGYLRSLIAGDPALLAVGPGPDKSLIAQVIGPRYRHAGRGPGWDWYVARSAGHDLFHHVRKANRKALAR